MLFMLNIGIIDADLIGRKKHRFPNLVCMKLSSYYKSSGNNVTLLTDYDNIESFDLLFLSKVFTDTDVPEWVLGLPNIQYGGTGFYYDKAPKLPADIEHSMPDYHLYDDWVESQLASGAKRKDFEYYLDYSIGFLTRGCFRQCQFCVNKNYKSCQKHSSIVEFYDESRPKLCFLDDNFFACAEWRTIIQEVKDIGKPFQFKQGLDERLLTDEKIYELASWQYNGDIIFAFDNIEDRERIEQKLQRIFELYPNWKRHLKFYVFCGFDRNDVWDNNFWLSDIKDTFERIRILSKYSALPYIMRYKAAYDSPYQGVYTTLAGWCNQPSIFKKFSYEMYCKCKGMLSAYSKYKRDVDGYLRDGGKKGSAWRYFDMLDATAPEIIKEYAYFTPYEIAEYGTDALHRKEMLT